MGPEGSFIVLFFFLTIIVFYTDTIAGEDTWGLGRQVMLGLELAGTQTRFFG